MADAGPSLSPLGRALPSPSPSPPRKDGHQRHLWTPSPSPERIVPSSPDSEIELDSALANNRLPGPREATRADELMSPRVRIRPQTDGDRDRGGEAVVPPDGRTDAYRATEARRILEGPVWEFCMADYQVRLAKEAKAVADRRKLQARERVLPVFRELNHSGVKPRVDLSVLPPSKLAEIGGVGFVDFYVRPHSSERPMSRTDIEAAVIAGLAARGDQTPDETFEGWKQNYMKQHRPRDSPGQIETVTRRFPPAKRQPQQAAAGKRKRPLPPVPTFSAPTSPSRQPSHLPFQASSSPSPLVAGLAPHDTSSPRDVARTGGTDTDEDDGIPPGKRPRRHHTAASENPSPFVVTQRPPPGYRLVDGVFVPPEPDPPSPAAQTINTDRTRAESPAPEFTPPPRELGSPAPELGHAARANLRQLQHNRTSDASLL